jgi:hypothetical protein
MQNLVNIAPAKRNYAFIDNIRCIAMISIVADHCFGLGDYVLKSYSANFWIYAFNIQVAKFGTVTFFLMAGFLLGDKFSEYSPAQYLGRRFKSTFKPWIIWSLVFLTAIMVKDAILALRIYHDPFLFWDTLLRTLKIVYLDSNYWFIINFLICIGILLLFKKNLYSLKLGAALLACTLFYSVNIYFEWIYPIHTTALFGFVFFLWLGAQLHKNWEIVERKLRTTPYAVFIGLFILALAFTLTEAYLLYQRKSIDPFNTLRISNLLYSLVAFGLLVKIRDFNVVYFKPRETTYGIYLIHYIIVYCILPEILIHLNLSAPADMPAWALGLYQYARLIVVYGLTLWLVKAINTTRFKWIIGNTVAVAK